MSAAAAPARLPPIAIYLAPGDYAVGDARHRIRTLLGSCVSITLWQRARQLGAMSHFLLAERGSGRISPAGELDARYGAEALTLMLRDLAARGVGPQECEAKLFGGGNMFPSHARDLPLRVGQRNGDAARAMLEAQGIRVVSYSLFGIGHRKIMFDIATGHVWSRQQPISPATPLAQPSDGEQLPQGGSA